MCWPFKKKVIEDHNHALLYSTFSNKVKVEIELALALAKKDISDAIEQTYGLYHYDATMTPNNAIRMPMHVLLELKRRDGELEKIKHELKLLYQYLGIERVHVEPQDAFVKVEQEKK